MSIPNIALYFLPIITFTVIIGVGVLVYLIKKPKAKGGTS